METKNNYKLTEVGKIPVEWNTARMDSLGSTYGGLSGKTKADFENGNKNFVSYKQIFNNPLLKNQEFETVCISEDEKQNEVKYGDVLFTTSSETPDEVAMSSMFLIEEASKYFLNSFSFGYRFNQLDSVDPQYYGYYFRGEYFRRLTFKLAQGSTRYNISKNKLIEEYIHVPPLKEQQKIAEILSTVDEQIDQTDQLIEKTTELKKGLMQKLLTKGIGYTEFKQTELGKIPVLWSVTTIKRIADVRTGGTPLKSNLSYWENGDIPWMSSGEVNKKFVNEVNGFITKEGFNNSNTTLLPKGTVMLAMNGQGKTRGTVAYLNMETTCNQSLAGIVSNKCYDSLFLYYFLEYSYNRLRNINGEGRSGLNLKLIRDFKIINPPLEEQKKIAEILYSVDEEIEGYQEEKAKYEELKKGLMQQLLTGKKRVKV